jgi:hypothetical protein
VLSVRRPIGRELSKPALGQPLGLAAAVSRQCPDIGSFGGRACPANRNPLAVGCPAWVIGIVYHPTQRQFCSHAASHIVNPEARLHADSLTSDCPAIRRHSWIEKRPHERSRLFGFPFLSHPNQGTFPVWTHAAGSIGHGSRFREGKPPGAGVDLSRRDVQCPCGKPA